MLLAHESGRRLRVALVGCGNHAYRSILPCLEYVPAELTATCDVDLARAAAYAKRFPGARAFGSLKELIAAGCADAAFICVGPKQHPELACEAMAGGLHVWMEKPPAADVAGIDRMIAAQRKSGRTVAVGFKKVFMPAVGRMRSFIAAGKFGSIRTIQGRFPTDVPADGAAVLAEGRFTDWLGNGVHPLSLMVELGGRPVWVRSDRCARGGGFVVMQFESGAVGSIHLSAGQSRSGAMERYEVVCDNGHMVLENNARLLVYRPGYPFDYRNGADFCAGGEDVAALVYEPQNTLSTLENKAIFLQGFVGEIEHFVNACLAGEAPTRGTLEFARAVMECYEAALLSAGTLVQLADLPSNRRP